MSIDSGAGLVRTGERTFGARTDEAYWNALGPFGGWIAALFVRAVGFESEPDVAPISLSLDFAGGMEPGPFEIRLRVLRANRSTTFWAAELVQLQSGAESLCAFATIVTARRRDSPEFIESVPPPVEPPEGLHRFAQSVAPLPFLQRLDMRFVGGAFPRIDDGIVYTWVRALDVESFDHEALTAVCDSGLPQIFMRLKRPVPVSSVVLNVFYHATEAALDAVDADFVLTGSRMRAATGGFFDTTTSVWTRSGTLLATTEQIVWFRVPS